jgi:hypothetical protein
MRTRWTRRNAFGQARGAFTVLETLLAMGLLLTLILAVCGAITFGFNTVRLSRENTRATQIMVEKTEQLRLFNWDQLTSTTNRFLPTNDFHVRYYSTNLGVTYTGRVSIRPVKLAVPYSNDMREVHIRLNWQTGNMPRTRTMTTFVSRYGIQNYIY